MTITAIKKWMKKKAKSYFHLMRQNIIIAHGVIHSHGQFHSLKGLHMKEFKFKRKSSAFQDCQQLKVI